MLERGMPERGKKWFQQFYEGVGFEDFFKEGVRSERGVKFLEGGSGFLETAIINFTL